MRHVLRVQRLNKFLMFCYVQYHVPFRWYIKRKYHWYPEQFYQWYLPQITRFMGPTWGRQDPGGPHENCYLGLFSVCIYLINKSPGAAECVFRIITSPWNCTKEIQGKHFNTLFCISQTLWHLVIRHLSKIDSQYISPSNITWYWTQYKKKKAKTLFRL